MRFSPYSNESKKSFDRSDLLDLQPHEGGQHLTRAEMADLFPAGCAVQWAMEHGLEVMVGPYGDATFWRPTAAPEPDHFHGIEI